jgi:subtilisin family serine protease
MSTDNTDIIVSETEKEIRNGPRGPSGPSGPIVPPKGAELQAPPEEENRFYLPPWTAQAVPTALAEISDWSIDYLGIQELWKQNAGEGVRVLILDTGVDTSHSDLKIEEARDFTGSLFGGSDRNGHGTWCCGMVGAIVGNNTGVRGIAHKATIFSGKVLGDDGSGTDQTIARGMQWALQLDVHIISLSLGGPRMSEGLHDLFKQFVSKKQRFIFAAAGNQGTPNSINYPAIWPECICVAAHDKHGVRAPFSSRGDRIDISAPGVDMISTVPNQGYAKMSGTSMACPTTAAIGALVLSKDLKMAGNGMKLDTTEDMRELLLKTAIDKGKPGPDDEYGPGLLNPGKVLEGLLPIMPPPSKLPGMEFKFGKSLIHIPARSTDDLKIDIGIKF